jgi:hypothetical protein
MLTRVIDNPRVANVMAFLTLFIVLGSGGAYAASKLRANSVGSREVKTGAIHSSEIYDGGILLRDLNKSTRAALRGQSGPAGPAGPVGPSAVKHSATVTAAGAFTAGDAKVGGRAGAIGRYTIGFSASLANCVPVATPADLDAASDAHAVRTDDTTITVQTFNAANEPADLPFQLIVAC